MRKIQSLHPRNRCMNIAAAENVKRLQDNVLQPFRNHVIGSSALKSYYPINGFAIRRIRDITRP
jgi:hypothetical protein